MKTFNRVKKANIETSSVKDFEIKTIGKMTVKPSRIKELISTAICIILGHLSFAQIDIFGQVEDMKNEPLSFANVILLQATDSTLVKGTITDMDGTFIISDVSKGRYLLNVSMIGFKPFYSEVKVGETDISLGSILMQEGAQQLDEVVVKSVKPIYNQKIDRLIINVESSILSSGSSALEILERSPGVVVNRQSGSIAIIGKDGVQVLINGKPSYLPKSSIVQLLEGMNSNNIESIELITTPPARFDAEGNAGFINIVLKKQPDDGLNGSYSLSGGVGNGTNTSNDISFNYRKGKFNVFGNYSFFRNDQGQIFTFNRSFINEDNRLSDLMTVSERDPIQRNHNVRFGIDYEISNKTIIGLLLGGYDNKWTMEAVNQINETENSEPNSFAILINSERNQWQHFSSNFNLKHNFEENEFINFNVDYLHYYNENPTNYVNTIFDSENIFLSEEFIISDKTTPINFLVSSADYSKGINDNFKLEAGIKVVSSNFNNDVVVETSEDGQMFIEDPTLTSRSNLDEKIVAAYTSVDYILTNRINLKLGLRFEHTDSELDSDREGIVVDRSFGNLFPSAYVSYKANDTLSFNLSYSRRITRPTFNDLAPFVIFVDPNTFFAGNPALQPAFSNSLKFDVNYRSLLLSLQYSMENESIAGYQERLDDTVNRLFFETVNLDNTNIFTVTLGLPLTVTNWWKIQNNVTYLNTKVSNIFDGSEFKVQQHTFNLNNTHSFLLTENLSSEINLNYFGPSLFGFVKYDEIFRMDIGIQKDFGDKWGTLTFNINDLWDSFFYTGGTSIPEQNLSTNNLWDRSNRTFSLTYTNFFGNNKLKSERKRKTGAEEEKKRIN
ncbi:MAG: outer membrane beta-barrel family protein [Bacteroidota bacterium]